MGKKIICFVIRKTKKEKKGFKANSHYNHYKKFMGNTFNYYRGNLETVLL